MMTFNNLLECSFWENLNFVCFRFQGCWEQDGNRWWYFLRKILNKCEKVDFAQIRHFSIAEMGKASSKSSIKEETYYTTKVLNCNRWTAIWSLLVPKITDQTNKPYFKPCIMLVKLYPLYFCSWFRLHNNMYCLLHHLTRIVW